MIVSGVTALTFQLSALALSVSTRGALSASLRGLFHSSLCESRLPQVTWFYLPDRRTEENL